MKERQFQLNLVHALTFHKWLNIESSVEIKLHINLIIIINTLDCSSTCRFNIYYIYNVLLKEK